RYQQKYLRFERADAPVSMPRTIANRPREGGCLHFYYDVNPFYVDTLDPEVARLFLQAVHERYVRELGGGFQKLAGFFTDEPQVSRNGIPWSLTLPDAYRARWGEDLRLVLPDLFLPGPTAARTRFRFWVLVRDLFVDGFTRQLYEWCEAHGTRLTGHMVLEETLLSQLTSNGAVMPHYEYFHIPGMDWLGRRIDPSTAPLQVSSVAHQLGKRQVLSETFALCGWDVSFEDFQWIYEWQMVRGVTLLCQHLEGYSLRGIRKRDYPASIFIHQPWWPDFKRFVDRVSRIGMALSDGEARFDVLVLHPQSSAYLAYDDGENAGIGALGASFQAVLDELEAHQVPFHIGDERILARHGAVQGGKLAVGAQRYRAVVLPDADVVQGSTLKLLVDFARAGGSLLRTGRAPSLVDGLPAGGELADLAREVPLSGLADALPADCRPISVRERGRPAAAIAATRRAIDGGQLYYFVNSRADRVDATIRLRARSLMILDPDEGRELPAPYRRDGEYAELDHAFGRAQSLLLIAYDDYDAPVAPPAPARAPINMPGAWRIAAIDENALTLDFADVYFDGELIERNMPINDVQERACALRRPVEIRLVYRVRADVAPDGPLHLVTETPEKFALRVNGREVPTADCGPYLDRAFRRVDITGLIEAGDNEVELTTSFSQPPEVYENIEKSLAFESEKNKLSYGDEIETCYLVGRFGVSTPGMAVLPRRAMRCAGDFALTAPPTSLSPGAFQTQGLPFFAGTVTLKKHVTLTAEQAANRSLAFEKLNSTVTRVAVNGAPAGTITHFPYEVALDGLREGDNEIEISITNNLRNLLGPHHLAEGESYAVGPFSFFRKSALWAPWSAAEAAADRWNGDYCFVEAGLFLA
ncbi:MAG: hypothetical protein GX558_09290, partial [Clostridiales bacterium]|nr:hypothetical protein [Clostridiales bacterium]